jgi:hypothetical protein
MSRILRSWVITVLLLVFFSACTKTAVKKTDSLKTLLKTRMLQEDYALVDFGKAIVGNLRSGNKLYQFPLRGREERVLVEFGDTDNIVAGVIFSAKGSVTKHTHGPKYSGVLLQSGLDRRDTKQWVIKEGFAQPLDPGERLRIDGAGSNPKINTTCDDCTIPEVVVSNSNTSTGISWASWLNLYSLFGMASPFEYLNMAPNYGSDGVDGTTVIIIDFEVPQNKERIDPKKYTDCFGSIPDGPTTLYTVTISADLPTDGHPEIFYNWDDGSPGHAFIELSKSTPAGGVTQNFGFYPTSSYKLMALENITLGSKLVDDGGHEYQARYTISVTAAQFQAAVNAVNAAQSLYNVCFFNCTDFALGVFNAAGANFTIPQHVIPGFGSDGSNTPQGLYEKIQTLKDNGVANATTTNSKEYANSSKGPCN